MRNSIIQNIISLVVILFALSVGYLIGEKQSCKKYKQAFPEATKASGNTNSAPTQPKFIGFE